MPARSTLVESANIALVNIQVSAARMQVLQEQVSTGKKINRPSDGPSETRKILSLRSEGRQLDQYKSNIQTAKQSLEFSSSALQSMTELVERIQELTVQGISDNTGQLGRRTIASEINALLESIFQTSNTSKSGLYIFGGTATSTKPFTAQINSNGKISGAIYNGNRDLKRISVGPGINVPVNQLGVEVFVDSGLISSIVRIRDDFSSGGKHFASGALTDLNQAFDTVINSVSNAGGVLKTLELTDNRVDETILSVIEILAETESVDLAKVILDLKEQETVLQAALASSAMLFRISILDYL